MSDHTPERLRLSIAAEAVDDLPTRLNRFAEVCRNWRGVRVVRMDTGFDLSVDLARVEPVGPVIEAAAAAAGLRIAIDDLGAEIRSSGPLATPHLPLRRPQEPLSAYRSAGFAHRMLRHQPECRAIRAEAFDHGRARLQVQFEPRRLALQLRET